MTYKKAISVENGNTIFTSIIAVIAGKHGIKPRKERSNMKQKLWIMWGVFAMTSIIMLFAGGRTLAYVFAFASAIAGWIAFLKD